jgi:TonB-dependent SusC/RagA subfamily outer membrane receptor
MPFLYEYILKLSLSLGVVFLFYHFVLRRLTFYNWNRWYLLGYTILCFFLPFIDISIALEQSAIKDNAVITWVPVLGQNFITEPADTFTLGAWDYAGLVLLTGIMIMLIRFSIQLWSIRKMRRNAVLLSDNGMRIYQVDAAIIPFSFGDSIFINKDQHSIHELEEIIRHEFVHVKQRHSVDIIWGELLCLLNWYNPFAWLLKKGIRQNLEFIADRHVLEQGMDRKQYQYLLLKVVGNNHFSIANQFNFSSLKKRIAMMNKLRSARFHLVKFLFILPLLSVLLLAFRNEWKKTETGKSGINVGLSLTDTLPDKRLPPPPPPPPPVDFMKEFLKRNPDIKSVSWTLKNEEGQNLMFIHRKDGKMEEYNLANQKDLDKAVAKYGEIPVAPPPPPPPLNTVSSSTKDFLKRHPELKYVGWVFGRNDEVARIVITKKDGSTEEVNVETAEARKAAEKKYGTLPYPPPPPPAAPDVVMVQGYPVAPAVAADVVTVQGYPITPASPKEVVTVQGYPIAPAAPADVVTVQGYRKTPTAPADVVTVQGYPVAPASPMGEVVVTGYGTPRPPVKMPENVKSIKITNENKAEVELKNGKTEKYDLNKPNEKAKFDAKYPAPPPPPPVPAQGVKVAGIQVRKSDGLKAVEGKSLPDNLIYVIDGIITTKYEMDKISPDKIASIDILKGDAAVALYGEKAKEGVVQIKLKYEAQPLYVINGEISSRETMDKLKPEQIESVDVLKGEKATAAYGDKGKNGVIMIKTKK